MDEFSSGMEPEVKKYLKKVLNSFFVGAFWLIAIATAGIFFKLGFVRDGFKWYNIVFYFIAVTSLFFLIRYYYKVWNKLS